MQRLINKSAVITGGGSGIGQAACLRLAEEGATVWVVDLNQQAAEDTVEAIKQSGGTAQAVICDIANTQLVNAEFDRIVKQSGIDILVNSAGIAHIGNLESTAEQDLDRLYQVNVKGVYNCMAAAVRAMKEKQQGVIVNLASVASSVGIADRFAYSMSKGAVLTMTYSVAKDYIHHGIRCNAIAPGRVHTPFVDNFIADNYPDNQQAMFDKLSQTQPIGRMGTPTEMAALIAYLCSDESSFITGVNFPIDGGFVTLNN